MLLRSLSTAASAREDKACSQANMAGDREYVFSGMFTWRSERPRGEQATITCDCTGTTTVGIYDQSGTLLRKATVASISNGREGHAIMPSLMVGSTPVAPVIILTMKKLLPDRDNEQ